MSSDDPISRAPDDGEALWFFGTLTTVRVSADERGDVAIVHQLLKEGTATPLHRQPEDPESFHVQRGELEFFAGDDSFVGGPGTTVHIPAGVAHGFRVLSDEAEVVIITTEQHERFFRAAGEPAQRREVPPPAEPDMERFMPIAEAHAVEILGPLPS